MTGAHRPQRPFRRHNRRDAARAARRNRARYRAHDAYIAGAAAQIAAHRHPYLPLAEGFGAQHEIARADQHPRGAVAALQGVLARSEEHTYELQSPYDLVCRLLLEKKKICLVRFFGVNGYLYTFVWIHA